MDMFLVEITIVQEVKANSKKEALDKAIPKIPKLVFDKFNTNVEVNWR